jgi:protein gp37
MGSTKIEYLDATWNFLTGCNNWKDPTICGGGGSEFKCWAKSMADRFGRDFTPKYNRDAFVAKLPKEPSRIGVCFTGDLFQDWIFSQLPIGQDSTANGQVVRLRDMTFLRIVKHPEHQFFFLTKNPLNLHKWGHFPDNAWVGVSVTDDAKLTKAFTALKEVGAAHRWLSIEPLLKWDMSVEDTAWTLGEMGIDWVVVGGLSNKPINQQPSVESVVKIIRAADLAGIPVFIKNNLAGVTDNPRQELPEFTAKAMALTHG